MKPIASIDKCTTCSTCVAHCPVTKATRIFNGPKLTGPSSERFRLFTKGEIEALDYCSNCKNCDISCPCGVQVSTLNMLARGEYCKQHKPPLRDWVLAHGHKLALLVGWGRGLVPGKLLGATQGLIAFGMTNPVTRWIMDRFGIDRRAPMPVFAPHSFMQLFQETVQQNPSKKRVVFFPGCYINDYDPQTGLDVVWMLRKAGYEVVVPDLGCCGVPLVANGFFDEAERLSQVNTAELARWARQGLPILTACPSCSLMLKQEYAELFPKTPDTSLLQLGVRDACEFVQELMEKGELELDFHLSPTKLVYHAPCHLRAQGLGTPGYELLQRLPGLHHTGDRVEDARAGCCGIAGSYGFKKGKYEVAAQVGADLFDTVKASKAEYALSECGTCRTQIAHHCRVRVLHPLSWLRKLAK